MSGGGGSSGQTYYANQDKLFGTQADIAQNMYNEYARRAPTYLNNTASMTNEAMSGALATRARNTAGADASAALGQGLQAAARNTARYGAEYNPNRMNQMNQDAAIQGAATKSAAMNSAEQWAEDQKWNRNAGAYGQIAGMGTGAMEGMGSAGRGYGSMAAQASQNDQANAQGMGVAGGYVGKALFSADGGLVKKRKMRSRRKKKDGVCLAAGGLAPVNWRAQPTSGGPQKSGSGVGQFLTAMAPAAMKYGLEKTGITDAVKGGIKEAWGGIKTAITGPQSVEMPMGTLTDVAGDVGVGELPMGTLTDTATTTATDAAATTATDTATTTATDAATTTATDAAATGAATAAAEAAALETAGLAAAEAGLGAFGGAAAGAETGAALGPWGAAAGAIIGGLMSMADGGSVKRKDMTHGGEVDGPGTETSDDIPAWLSDNEYVLNAEAVKLIGVDTLDAINQKGLEMRRGGSKKPQVSRHGLKLASGGNLGVALGSAAKTLMALDEQDQRKELIQIQKNKAAQEAEAFGWQRGEQEERLRQRAAEQALAAKYKPFFESAAKGDYSFAQQLLPQYNQQKGAFNDGHTAAYQSSPYGDVMHISGPDGKVVRSVPLNPESVNQLITQAYMLERAGLGSGQFNELVRHQADERKFGLDERRLLSDDRYKQGNLGLHQQQLLAQERHWADQIALEKARLAQQRALHAASAGLQSKEREIGMTNDGQLILRGGDGNISTRPIMVNGKPATPEQLMMFKRMYQQPAPQNQAPLTFKDFVSAYGTGDYKKDLAAYNATLGGGGEGTIGDRIRAAQAHRAQQEAVDGLPSLRDGATFAPAPSGLSKWLKDKVSSGPRMMTLPDGSRMTEDEYVRRARIARQEG